MTDSEYRKNNYKFLKISVGAIIKNPETQKCVPDYLKTKMMCKNAVKKLQFVIRLFLIDIRLKKCVMKC